MIQNKKGQVFLYGIMLCVIILVFALGLAPALRNVTDDTRSTMGCPQNATTQTNLSVYTEGGCLFLDYYQPAFVGFLIVIAGILIAARIIGD